MTEYKDVDGVRYRLSDKRLYAQYHTLRKQFRVFVRVESKFIYLGTATGNASMSDRRVLKHFINTRERNRGVEHHGANKQRVQDRHTVVSGNKTVQ